MKNFKYFIQFLFILFLFGVYKILGLRLSLLVSDFIFTLFSEEFGFIGSFILLLIYAIIIYRIVAIGASSRNYFGKIMHA